MQFTQSISYPGTVDEVVAMYLTPDYLERRFGQFVVEGSQAVSVEGERVSFAGTVRPELIPAAAARFVKSDLRVSFTEEWTTNEAGATVRTYTCDRADKGFYDDHWRGVHNAEFMSPGCDPSFDSYDADGNELPDGRYTLTIEAATDGPSSQTHQMTYEFTLDTSAPVVSNLTVSGEGDARTVSFDVTDSSPAARISPSSSTSFR